MDSAEGPKVLGLLLGLFSKDDKGRERIEEGMTLRGAGRVVYPLTNSGWGGRLYTGHGELPADTEGGAGVLPADVIGAGYECWCSYADETPGSKKGSWYGSCCFGQRLQAWATRWPCTYRGSTEPRRRHALRGHMVGGSMKRVLGVHCWKGHQRSHAAVRCAADSARQQPESCLLMDE